MILDVIQSMFSLNNLLFMNIGLAAGIIVGALPGLTGTMAIALLLPLTYGVDAITGMFLLLGVYLGGIYGGSITAILINTPGTPASAATSLDGYPMAKRGEAKRALSLALYGSFIGGIFSVIVLIVAAPQIASIALSFGPPEYFALAIFGLTIIASVSEESIFKGLLMGFFGLLISTIGLDPIDGIDRFSFDIVGLLNGVGIIPALIGLFAITEIFEKIRSIGQTQTNALSVEGTNVKFAELIKYKWLLLKSSLIGTFIGAVPGTGAAISSFMAYNEAKRSSSNPENFGKGCDEGILAPEAANNAVTGATLIPLLTLGIPGDTNTAVLIGALTMQGIVPGPKLFVEQASWVYSIMFGLILVNIFLLIQGKIFINFFSNVTKISSEVLVPILVVLCVIGAYAVNNTIFDAVLMLVFGIVGYAMKSYGFPLTPAVIGIVLGPLAESNLRRSLIMSNNDWMIFFQKPISTFFLVLSLVMLAYPLIKKTLEKRRTTN